jgi:S-adenosylmethionine decarboxylase
LNDSISMGRHFILEIYDVPFDLLNDLNSIQNVLQVGIEKANMTILNIFYHQFNPQGLTILFALAESHVSIHTFPEKGSLSADAYTCGNGSPEIIVHKLIDHFKSSNYKIREFAR